MTALGLAVWLLTVPAAADVDRDVWQRPSEVMDVLGITAGSSVADVGSGDGYFTFHLAGRVGPGGRVYAVDIARDDLEAIRRRARDEGLAHIETILGETDDPLLPEAALDVVLVVNAYHEMSEHDAMLRGIHRSLKPGGRLAIIDKVDDGGESRAAYRSRHKLPASVAREDAARNGFRFREEARGFLRPRGSGEPWYFLVFEKPAAGATSLRSGPGAPSPSLPSRPGATGNIRASGG
jgi:predicted methyltransferase